MLLCCILVFIFVVLFSIAGLGSATAVVPVLVFFGFPASSAVTYALMVNVVSSLVINGHILIEGEHNLKRALCLVIPAFAVSLVGGYVSSVIPHRLLIVLFSAFLFYSSLSMVGLIKIKLGSGGFSKESVCLREATLGGLAGFLAGLLGIGGGSILLPIMVNVGFEPKEVVPVVAFTVLLSSTGGLLSHLAFGNISLNQALLMVLIAVLGAILGGLIRKRMHTATLKVLLAFLLVILAVKMLFKAFA